MDQSYLLKRYAVVTLLTLVAVSVIAVLLETFMDHDIGSVGGMIGVFVPAMDAGQAYVRRGHGRPANGFAWKISAIFLCVNVAIGVALAVLFSLLFGGGAELIALMSFVGISGMATIVVVVSVLHWLLTRFFFGFGVKNELKMQEKLAAKKQP